MEWADDTTSDHSTALSTCKHVNLSPYSLHEPCLLRAGVLGALDVASSTAAAVGATLLSVEMCNALYSCYNLFECNICMRLCSRCIRALDMTGIGTQN